MGTTIYVSIGNSDDKLSQLCWHRFARDFTVMVRSYAQRVYGEWHSLPNEPYQNICMAAEIPAATVSELRESLTVMRKHYGQDSIAWAEAETEFI